MLRKISFIALIITQLAIAFNAMGSDLNTKRSQPSTNKQPQISIDKTVSIKPTPITFDTLEWDDLIPQDDLNALLNPPGYIDDIEDGGFEDDIGNEIKNFLDTASDDRYQQALVSTNIIKDLNGRAVRIPGFVVPVEFDEEIITEFFLVPYFGACIHSPPPPPNQIIYVQAAKGLKLETLYDPFWISGKLSTTLVENFMATAAYSLEMASYEAYTE
ncbi:MAG: DUF3299 domain-containing protein [Porticoccaceae bacterium]